MIQTEVYNWKRWCTFDFKTRVQIQVNSSIQDFYIFIANFFALLRVWLYNGHCFKVRAQVCILLLIIWSVTILSLHFNALVHWSLILHQYWNAHKLYVYWFFFTVLLLKLQYEILVCQMKISSGSERLLASFYNVCVFKVKCVFPYFQGLHHWWIDDPIKPGNWENENCFALYGLM